MRPMIIPVPFVGRYIVQLPHGPKTFWRSQAARIGLHIYAVTRLVGHIYWVRPL